MKKFLSLLFVLVLSLSFVACGSTKVKGELVTDPKDVYDFLEDLEYTEVSYKFTISYEEEYKDAFEKYTCKEEVKGSINYEEKDGFPVISSFKVTSNGSEKDVEATIDGKKTTTYSNKRSIVFDGKTLYRSSEVKGKGPNNSSKSSKKTCYDLDFATDSNLGAGSQAGLLSIIEIISSSMDGMCFLDEDTMTIVASSEDSHTVIVIKCDGKDVKSVVIEYKDSESSYTIKLTVCDEVDIERPKDASDYEDITDDL